MSSDFKTRFGLDYLTKNPSTPRSSSGDSAPPRGLQDALITYGSKVLVALNGAENNTMPLLDLARQLSERIDTLAPVMSYLQSNGYVVRHDDPVGNDAFQLTNSGIAVAKKAAG